MPNIRVIRENGLDIAVNYFDLWIYYYNQKINGRQPHTKISKRDE